MNNKINIVFEDIVSCKRYGYYYIQTYKLEELCNDNFYNNYYSEMKKMMNKKIEVLNKSINIYNDNKKIKKIIKRNDFFLLEDEIKCLNFYMNIIPELIDNLNLIHEYLNKVFSKEYKKFNNLINTKGYYIVGHNIEIRDSSINPSVNVFKKNFLQIINEMYLDKDNSISNYNELFINSFNFDIKPEDDIYNYNLYNTIEKYEEIITKDKENYTLEKFFNILDKITGDINYDRCLYILLQCIYIDEKELKANGIVDISFKICNKIIDYNIKQSQRIVEDIVFLNSYHIWNEFHRISILFNNEQSMKIFNCFKYYLINLIRLYIKNINILKTKINSFIRKNFNTFSNNISITYNSDDMKIMELCIKKIIYKILIRDINKGTNVTKKYGITKENVSKVLLMHIQ